MVSAKQSRTVEVLDQRGQGLIECRGQAPNSRGHVVVQVPAPVDDRHQADSGSHQPPGKQQALSGLMAAVSITHLFRLVVNLKRVPSRLGTEQIVGAFVKGTHRGDRVGFGGREDRLGSPCPRSDAADPNVPP